LGLATARVRLALPAVIEGAIEGALVMSSFDAWVMTHEGARDRGIVQAIHDWNLRKQTFTDQQILLAAKRLAYEGWLTGANA